MSHLHPHPTACLRRNSGTRRAGTLRARKDTSATLATKVPRHFSPIEFRAGETPTLPVNCILAGPGRAIS